MTNEKVILLVEDSPDDVDLTRRALSKTPVLKQVVVARDGVEALDYLYATGTYAGRDSTSLPQLVLLDLKLPRLDGLQLLEHIRSQERTRLLPVVILTSSNQAQDEIEGYRVGANSYVRKPVKFEEFVQAVQQLEFYWLVLNEPPPGVRWS